VVARPVAKVDQRVDGRLDPQPLGQRRGQQQPGVGDRVDLIEADDGVLGLCNDGIEKVPSWPGSWTSEQRHSPCSEGLSHNLISHCARHRGGSRLRGISRHGHGVSSGIGGGPHPYNPGSSS
jgi:hypothetical protein